MLKEQFYILFFTFNIPNFFCRPPLAPGESLVELEIFQEHMTQYSSPCPDDCDKIVNDGLCDSQPFRDMSVCNGHSYDCKWLGSTTACISAIGKHQVLWASGRDNLFYGKNQSCPAEEQFREIGTAPDPLGVCHCTCFTRNWAIYVGEFRSRENESYVITTMRFIVHNNVFYLQPAERQLGTPASEISWIPLPSNPSELRWITLQNSNFFLDLLVLDENYVLTGIKLEYMEAQYPKPVKGFGLNIRGVKRITPHALSSADIMVIKPLPDTERCPYPGPRPQYRRLISKNSYETYAYVALKRSSLEEDFGQKTIPPFLNWVPYDNSSLLGGLGIRMEMVYAGKPVITFEPYPFMPEQVFHVVQT